MAKKEKTEPAVQNNWEFKDRVYELKGDKKPIITTIPSKHSRKRSLLWFDPDKGTQRELRYATNQSSPFVDEQKGEVTLEQIVFRDGTLYVPKQNVALQQLLSLYHPLKDGLYYEVDNVKRATNDLAYLEAEIDALNTAKNLDLDHLEAILRVELGSSVNTMTSKEIKRDALLFARRNPILFLELASDENVQLRNFGIRAVEAGLIELSQDQRNFSWASTGRKLLSVPFEENPYSALAAWFKTDEGVEVYSSIEKRLK